MQISRYFIPEAKPEVEVGRGKGARDEGKERKACARARSGWKENGGYRAISGVMRVINFYLRCVARAAAPSLLPLLLRDFCYLFER